MYKAVTILFVLMSAFVSATDALAATACTKEYVPVCGQKEVCNTEMCWGETRTYGNSCVLRADGAVPLYQGECKGGGSVSHPATDPIVEPAEPYNPPTYTPPAGCVAWFDGCNSCSGGAGEPAACTLRACLGEPQPGYCIRYADDRVPPDVISDPDACVSSPPSSGYVGNQPQQAVDLDNGAETLTRSENPVVRFFNSIASWFKNLFSWR